MSNELRGGKRHPNVLKRAALCALAVGLTIGGVGFALATAQTASATSMSKNQTVTVTWVMDEALSGSTDVTWPQHLQGSPGAKTCGHREQIDKYKYDTAAHKKTVDDLITGGVLNSPADDSSVYVSNTFADQDACKSPTQQPTGSATASCLSGNSTVVVTGSNIPPGRTVEVQLNGLPGGDKAAHPQASASGTISSTFTVPAGTDISKLSWLIRAPQDDIDGLPIGGSVTGSACDKPNPPVDVCTNLSGNQTTVPPGYVLVNGKCVVITKPNPSVDVCSNIPGVQTMVPSGYIANGTVCTKKTVIVDVCTNLSGVQTMVPAGYTVSGTTCSVVVTPQLNKNLHGPGSFRTGDQMGATQHRVWYNYYLDAVALGLIAASAVAVVYWRRDSHGKQG